MQRSEVWLERRVMIAAGEWTGEHGTVVGYAAWAYVTVRLDRTGADVDARYSWLVSLD